MYSSKTSSLLKKTGVEIGDKVKINAEGESYEGILMPRAGESDDLVIKLDSGYNIGVNPKDAKISLVEKSPKKAEEAEEPHKRGDIAIIGCGGTIASKVEYRTGAVYPTLTPKDMFNAFPKIQKMASVHTKLLFQLFSEDMSIGHWKLAAQAVRDEIKEGAKGIVIMHGTDTMSYTSAALSFALQSLPVPVVLVGAQRSSDRPSSDNETNLLNSILIAKSDIAHVGICMHGSSNDDFAHFHPGTKVRKMHSSRRDAFQSINTSPLAKADYKTGKVEPLVQNYNKRDEKRKLDLQDHFSENVGMLYVHPGINPKLVDKFADYQGVVLVGTGLGHTPTNPFDNKLGKSIAPNLKSLADSGVSLVMSTQTIYGRVNMDVYSSGRLLQEIGVIGSGADWTPETAYVKLCWVLGKEKGQKKVKELMMKNVAC
ncbi:Glutamyl-tRNA(Gln) amidotransferase subunit D [uncultured archaeon]|nr:Glutamyl-tRNA(Gln) amidotransferase subunit D [uncultured archaeon]